MQCLPRFAAFLMGLTVLALSARSGAQTPPQAPTRTELAWTLEEALQAFAQSPRDPFIQFVALQLARRDGDAELARITRRIDQLARDTARADRREQVDLFSIFTGALAVHESLQLDTMRTGATSSDREATIPIAELRGPSVESHPFKSMLGGRTPEVSPLSQMVPADQYFIASRSLSKLVELLEHGDLWSTHLFNQVAGDATSSGVGDRIREQLAVRTSGATRPFYNLVVKDVAVTGSDLYFREGSDVTLIFRLQQPGVFRARMAQFLAEATERPGAVRRNGTVLGVDYVHVATPDRRVSLFAADPRPDVHVRSNSLVGLRRVLAAMLGDDVLASPRLGDIDEFKYIRTLMPLGADEEDVFIYLSDPFIRRVVGPELKIKEFRRMVAHNHLRMLGHGALLFRTEFGRDPASLDELIARGCALDGFGKAEIASPWPETYRLATDPHSGLATAIGTVSGTAIRLTPCCELNLETVTEGEAKAYRDFVTQYERYWQMYFDPIAVRVKLTPEQYRAETIVLPLINNSIYGGLTMVLGGEPEPLDALPVPDRNILSIGLRFHKDALMAQAAEFFAGITSEISRELGITEGIDETSLERFVSEGLGNQVGLHAYDAMPFVDLDLTGFLGQLFGSFGRRLNDETLWIAMLVASLNSPIYLSVPVKETRIVDEFLEKIDPMLARLARRPQRGGFFDVGFDYYRLEGTPDGVVEKTSGAVRAFTLEFGPIRWRFFWARIGDGLYVASKKFILDDLARAEVARSSGGDPAAKLAAKAHGMIRLRPSRWQRVLADYQLGWIESNRRACFANLTRLSSVARGYLASHPEAAKADPVARSGAIVREAEELDGLRYLSPDGGEYQLATDRRSMEHSVYGSPAKPRQPFVPGEKSALARLLRELSTVTAELTFLEDGLHAVVTVDRKKR